MRRVFRALAAAAVSIATWAPAQPLEPHLIPVNPDLAEFGPLQPYHLALRQHLLGRGAGPAALVTPSFQREWAVQLAYDRGQPFVIYAVMDEQLWGLFQERASREGVSEAVALRSLAVAVTRRSAPLAHGTAHAVEAAWETLLSAARRPLEYRRIIDGTSYLVLGAGPPRTQRVGLTRSPQLGTPVGALADLVTALRRHVEAPAAASAASETELQRMAQETIETAKGAR